jgi:uncharacterized membrane protein
MAHGTRTPALKAAGLALLLVSSAVWADGQVTSQKARAAAATQASLAHAQQNLQQQQDQAIAKMQQELQALQAKQAAGHP